MEQQQLEEVSALKAAQAEAEAKAAEQQKLLEELWKDKVTSFQLTFEAEMPQPQQAFDYLCCL